MTSPPAFARNMQRPEAGAYIVSPATPQRFGTCLQRADRFAERLAVNAELSLPEIFQRALENANKIPLGFLAEPYAPRLARQFDPAPATIFSAK